jgi:hypothetical protein
MRPFYKEDVFFASRDERHRVLYTDCYIRVDQQNSLHRRFGDVCPTVRGSWRPVYFFDGRVSHMDLFQTFGIHATAYTDFISRFRGDILFGEYDLHNDDQAVWRGSDIHIHDGYIIHMYHNRRHSHVRIYRGRGRRRYACDVPGHGGLAAL